MRHTLLTASILLTIMLTGCNQGDNNGTSTSQNNNKKATQEMKSNNGHIGKRSSEEEVSIEEKSEETVEDNNSQIDKNFIENAEIILEEFDKINDGYDAYKNNASYLSEIKKHTNRSSELITSLEKQARSDEEIKIVEGLKAAHNQYSISCDSLEMFEESRENKHLETAEKFNHIGYDKHIEVRNIIP